eukprot:TRINITY_DN10606_c0_g1_i1.p1 TRINITY_DN10606_c0_g1~~TRINITY_DN10606_c0_g1_i1.p1  ORF type:complete len:479 (+),score=129.80 TRINITY_DN10606_c0_g1_i1:88-1524(+)
MAEPAPTAGAQAPAGAAPESAQPQKQAVGAGAKVEVQRLRLPPPASRAPAAVPRSPESATKRARTEETEGSLARAGRKLPGGASPAYGGLAFMSPAYLPPAAAGGLSPQYAGLSPGRRPPEELGGVFRALVPQVLREIKRTMSRDIVQRVEVCSKDTSITQALASMSRANIRSIPIVDGDVLVGVVDLFDMVCYVVGTFSPAEIAAAKMPDLACGQDDPLVQKGKKVLEQSTMHDVLTAQGGHCAKYEAPTGGASGVQLLDVIKKSFLARPPTGSSITVHRAVIVTPQGQPITTISQSDVLRYMHIHKDLVCATTKMAEMTLEQLEMDKRKVLCLDSRTSALYALWKMKNYGVYSAAVVDNSAGGVLIQQLTVNCLRGMTADEFVQLRRPVSSFSIKGGRSREPCTVRKTDTLWQALHVLVQQDRLRAIMVDEGNHPIAQISALNIITSFMKRPRKAAGAGAGAKRPPPAARAPEGES